MNSNEDVARRWVEMVLSKKIEGSFFQALQDGSILCSLINQLYRSLGMKHITVPIETRDGTALSSRRQNTHTFLDACRTLGVADDALFRPNDLLKGSNPQKVYACILALQVVAIRMARQRTPDERASMGSNIPSSVESEDLKVDRLHSPHAAIIDWGDMSMFVKDATSSQAAWRTLLNLFEAQQAQVFPSMPTVHEGGAYNDYQGSGESAHALWRTEERVRSLVHEETACQYLTPELHGKLWMLLSGASTDMRVNKGHFAQIVSSSSVNVESIRQIDADVPRTVPEFDPDWSPEMQAKLRRVLVAYAAHNPSLGYCQGLNYVVARLLQFIESEEECFWLLTRMVAMLPEDYYTTMLGAAVDQHVFAELVSLQSPDILRHIERLGGFGSEMSLACTEWFCTLFGSPCRKEITMRVWDLLFMNGNEELFRMALALLQVEYPNIMSCHSYGDVLACLNQIGRDEHLDPKLLLHIAHDQAIVTTTRIEDLRAYYRLELASGIALSKDENESGSRTSELTTKKRKHPTSNRKIKSRTMSRHLSLEKIDVKVSDAAEAKYFPDSSSPPELLEDYWRDSDAGPGLWTVAKFKLITSPSDGAIDDVSRPRQFSDTSYRHTFTGEKPSSLRVSRSKSTAEGLRHRASYSHNPPTDHKPNNFLKKIEEWTHRTLKKKPNGGGLNFEFFGGALTGQGTFFFNNSSTTQISENAPVSTPSDPVPSETSDMDDSIAESPADLPEPSPPMQITIANRIIGSRSTPSLVSLEMSQGESSHDEGEDDVDRPRSSSTTFRPPRHHPTPDGRKPQSSMLSLDDVSPPDMRRHTSMPARGAGRPAKLNQSNLDTNNRWLRERAQVVSYLQRKASDVSSLTSDRDSLGSDDGTRRSHRAITRTNSFSFLGSLSVDLERSLLLEDKTN
ncbi:unnamed protein product [Aphanomyces euteiches]|nr:hypothetical protein Ae201684P_017750 [Aphanomyces euteiches]